VTDCVYVSNVSRAEECHKISCLTSLSVPGYRSKVECECLNVRHLIRLSIPRLFPVGRVFFLITRCPHIGYLPFDRSLADTQSSRPEQRTASLHFFDIGAMCGSIGTGFAEVSVLQLPMTPWTTDHTTLIPL
jgi:hypothetical protein